MVDILVQIYILEFAVFVSAIKIKEERSGRNQRYVTMEEIEEKSKHYLKFYKHMGDEEEVNEKVKIMSDRFQELYRKHGLDAIHDIFESVDDLELSIDREDAWQAYMAGLVYPKSPQEWAYARHLLAGLTSFFVLAAVMAAPISYKYARLLLRGPTSEKADAELKGAESCAEVLIRRMKKRSRRILYKPMLPSFSLKTESNKTSEEILQKAEEKMKMRILKEEEFKLKKKKEREEMLKEVRLDMQRRKRILLEDDESVSEMDDDKWSGKSCGQKDVARRKVKNVAFKNSRKCFGGKIRFAKLKKKAMAFEKTV